MKLPRFARPLALVACGGILFPAPQTVQAADVAPQSPTPSAVPAIEDIALGENQTLHGMVIDLAGQPLAGQSVSVKQLSRECGTTKTNEIGQFKVSGLKGGVYEVHCGSQVGVYRCWASNTAPPQAQSAATIVQGATVRGQRPMGQLFTSNTFIIAAVVAAAVAIPIIVHDSRNDNKSGS